MYTGFWKLCYQIFSLSTCYLEKLASNKFLSPPPSPRRELHDWDHCLVIIFHVPTLSVDFHIADNLKTSGQKTLKNNNLFHIVFPLIFFFFIGWRGRGCQCSFQLGLNAYKHILKSYINVEIIKDRFNWGENEKVLNWFYF